MFIRQDATAPKPLSLRRNFVWTLAGNVVYAGCQWGMLIVLAKLGSPEMLGRFVLGLAVTAPIMALADLHLRTVQATDAKRRYEFGHYLGLRLITTTLAVLIIAAVAFAGGFGRDTALVILAVGVAKAFESLSDVTYGLLQQRERLDRMAQLQAAKGLLLLAALGGAVYLFEKLLWGVVALILIRVLSLASFDLPGAVWVRGGHAATIAPRWNLAILAKLAWLAAPLGFVTALTSLNTNIPRYFVQHHLAEHQLGIFAAMAYFLVAGRTVTRALGQSATPRLARYYDERRIPAFRRLLGKLVGINTLVGLSGLLIALLMGRQILTICYAPEYAEHWDVFVWLMTAFTFQFVGAAFRCSLNAMRRFRLQLLVNLLRTIALAVLSLFLIARFGLQGAAWAILASRAMDLIMFAALTYLLLQRTCLDGPLLPSLLPNRLPDIQEE